MTRRYNVPRKGYRIVSPGQRRIFDISKRNEKYRGEFFSLASVQGERAAEASAGMWRDNGYYARLVPVRNGKKAVYVRRNESRPYSSRRYFRPIPETDPKLAKMFPVSLNLVLTANKKARQEFSKQFLDDLDLTSKQVRKMIDKTTAKPVLAGQIRQIEQYIANYEPILERLAKQSQDSTLLPGWEYGESNLNPNQWDKLFNHPLKDGTTLIQRLSPVVADLAESEPYVSMPLERRYDEIDKKIRRDMVLRFREMGYSEHSVFASISIPGLAEAFDYSRWPSWAPPRPEFKEPSIPKETDVVEELLGLPLPEAPELPAAPKLPEAPELPDIPVDIPPPDFLDDVVLSFPSLGNATFKAKVEANFAQALMRNKGLDWRLVGSSDASDELVARMNVYDRRLSQIANVWSGDPFKGWELTDPRAEKTWRSRSRKMQLATNKPNDVMPTNIPSWVKPGDIVVSRIGGKVSFYDPRNANQLPRNVIFIGVKKSEQEKYDVSALKYEIENRIQRTNTELLKGTMQQSVQVSEIKNLDFKEVPIEDQRKWAGGIKAVSELIDAEEKLIEKHRMLREGLRFDPSVRPKFRKRSEIR